MVALEDQESLVQEGAVKLRECTGAAGEIALGKENAEIATCKSSPPPAVL